MTDTRLLRLAAAAAILGAAAHVTASLFEPDWHGEPQEAVRAISDNGFFIGDRLLDLVGLFLTVGALTVVARTLSSEPGREWARAGQPFLVLMGALWAGGVLTSAALKEVADAWTVATPGARQAYLAAFDTTASVANALYFGAFVALGVYLATLSASVLAGRVYAPWIGRLAAVSGVLWLTGDLFSLASDIAFVALLAASLLFVAVLIGLGLGLWRQASSAQPRAVERLGIGFDNP